MITLWGRNNSTNVKKVRWVLEELDLPYQQILAGLEYYNQFLAVSFLKNHPRRDAQVRFWAYISFFRFGFRCCNNSYDGVFLNIYPHFIGIINFQNHNSFIGFYGNDATIDSGTGYDLIVYF